jgi:MinD-like ATPase involved in chromosome partitioning or flagellar assembly
LAAPLAAYPPEAGPRGRRLLVAGTTGGVGATTIASLIALGVAARTGRLPQLRDHGGGSLSSRVAAIQQYGDHQVSDLGAHSALLAETAPSPGVGWILVTSWDPASASTVLATLDQWAKALAAPPASVWPAPVAPRAAVLVNSTSAKRRAQPMAADLARRAPQATIVTLEWDPALAIPGPIDLATTHRATRQALIEVLTAFGL